MGVSRGIIHTPYMFRKINDVFIVLGNASKPGGFMQRYAIILR
jgi:hypothetical protein